MPGLCDQYGRGEAPAVLHRPVHPPGLPAQRGLGDRESVSQQGTSTAVRHHSGDPARTQRPYTP